MKPVNSQSRALHKVLEVVAARPAGFGYERPKVEGLSEGEVDRAAAELGRLGLVNGATVPSGLGPHVEHFAPSVLTAKGREFLSELK